MIQSATDIANAFEEGRFHEQRFYKSAMTSGDGQWQDWSYAAGQPGYDARIGTSGEFNPFIASNNDAIYFPSINSGETRHLHNITIQTTAGGTGQTATSLMLYDLLGVYPLIDGDSTDEQVFDNTQAIPRYESGTGVFPVLVNHVSPMISGSTATLKFDDTSDVERTVTVGVGLSGLNKVCSQFGGTTSLGSISMPIGTPGCKKIKSIQFSAAPGGLFSIYMIKPITTVLNCDGASLADKIATEKQMLTLSGSNCPRIYDGAWLGFFIMTNAGARTIASAFGHLTFIWG